MIDTQSYSILKSLFGARKVGVLATMEGGGPYTSLVAYSPSDDMRELYFSTRRESRKYANLIANPSVCMLVDDRANAEADFSSSIAVTAAGAAREVSGPERRALVEAHAARNPALKDFAQSPDTALIRISVDKYYIVSSFEEVKVCDLKSQPKNVMQDELPHGI